MVSRAFGPTVSELPSRKTRWARSLARVVTTSLACTSMPIFSTRSASVGGLPSGSPSVAEVMPTRPCAPAVPLSASVSAPIKAARSTAPRGKNLPNATPPQIQPTLETPAYPKHQVIVDKFVIRNGGISHKAAAGHAEGRPVIERDGQDDVGNCIRLVTAGGGVDCGVGSVVSPPLLGHRQVDRPRQAGLEE